VLDLPVPAIEVSGGEGGRYRARVVPPPGAARLRLIVTPASAVRGATLDGRELTGIDRDAEQVSVLYFAPSPEGVVLDLQLDEGAPAPELAAVAQWLRLPSEAQGGPPPRGPAVMATALTLDTDVTMVRTAVRLGPREAASPSEPEAEDGDGGTTPEENSVE
jgi:hypothetical protein